MIENGVSSRQVLQRAAGLALYTVARLELYTPSPSLGLNLTPITAVSLWESEAKG